MEVSKSRRQLSKRDLAIAAWEALDCESVGAGELEKIMRTLSEAFGEHAVESPAALARLLADEGAHLRHPEVLKTDAKWREKRLLGGAIAAGLKFSSLVSAAESIAEMERLRRELANANDEKQLRELRDVAISHKENKQLIAGSALLSPMERAKAREIAGWLDVWLRTPGMFADWLELRRAAPEFRRRFGDESDIT
jgi:hypothetical protein